MRYLRIILLFLLLIPSVSFAATAIPWSITNLTDTFIFPNLVNGSFKGIQVSASSTIGDGIAGLTTSGAATTTGNAYFVTTVGIATSSPIAPLHVVGNANPVALFQRNLAATNSAGGAIRLLTSGTTGTLVDGFGTAFDFTISGPGTPITQIGTIIAIRSGADNSGTIKIRAQNAGVSNDVGTFTNTGNVGITTTTPYANLSVEKQYGNTNSVLFAVASSTIANGSRATSLFVITSDGTVGIGTTTTPIQVNPNADLVVSGIGAVDIIASSTDNSTLSTAILEAYAPGSRVFLGAHGTNQNTTQYGITVGGWGELGAINSSFNTSNGLMIGTRTTATPIVFGTNSVERMRILAGGNVGIGTTSPYAQFAIHAPNGATNNTLFAIASSTQTATTTFFTVSNVGSTTIGGGTESTGLTILGGATTTGSSFVLGIQTIGSAVTNGKALSVIGSVNGAATTIKLQNTSGAANSTATFLLDLSNSITTDTVGAQLQAIRTNTGLAGTSDLSFSTSLGTTMIENARLTGAGNFGLSTSSPYAHLSMDNPASSTNATLFAIASSTNLQGVLSTSTIFTITNIGRLGLNVSNPVTLAQLHGGAGNSQLLFTNNTTGVGSGAYIGQLGGNDFFLVNQTAAGDFFFGTNNISRVTIKNAGNVGVGTTSPFSKLAVHANNGDTNGVLFAIASSTQTATTTLFSIDNVGHQYATTTIPVLSSCGTNPSMVGSDDHGTVTTGATAGGCTITFGNPWIKAPTCTLSEQTGSVVNAFSYTVSATAIVVTQTAIGGGIVDYVCRGNP